MNHGELDMGQQKEKGSGEPTLDRSRTAQLEFPGRRSFFGVLVAVGTAAVGALLSVPLLRFALFPLFKQTSGTEWAEVGEDAKFASLTEPVDVPITVETRDGWREGLSKKSVYVLPLGERSHRVLSPICPHMGCEVAWNGQQKEFFCPCHGSIFSAEGRLVRGPARRGMDYLDSKVTGGRLMVLYQYFRLLVSKREVLS